MNFERRGRALLQVTGAYMKAHQCCALEGNLLVPGAPCAFVQEAAAESTCVGCSRQSWAHSCPQSFSLGLWGTASGTQRGAVRWGLWRTVIQQSCSENTVTHSVIYFKKARNYSPKPEKYPCFLTIISVSLHPWFLLWPMVQEVCYFPCSAEEVPAKDQWLTLHDPVSMAHECPLHVKNPFLSSVQYWNGTLNASSAGIRSLLI